MQSQAAETYTRTKRATANPRELEAMLLTTAAGRLQAVRDNWETRRSELDGALSFNRRLWTIFVTSVSRPDSPLPQGLKQNVANLGLFVFNHTIGILASPEPQKLATLISINRNIAEGLRTPVPQA